MAKIKIGDVVKGKSGGPRMTVKKISGNHLICQWMDNDMTLKECMALASILDVLTVPFKRVKIKHSRLGDVVKLKSGSVKMKVVRILRRSRGSSMKCQWLSRERILQEASFSPLMLNKIS